jgi:hypothetical protein
MTNNQPVAVSAAIGGVLSTGVALAAVLWPDRLDPVMQAAIIGFGNSVILTAGALFAMHRSTPIANPTLAAGTPVKVAGSEDSVIIETSPPGPTGIEGGGDGGGNG